MSKLEIDYSEVTPQAVTLEPSDWEPPTHKFFGKKGQNGKMEKEPIYTHIEYPRFMYAMKNGKITAKVVHSDAERDSLGSDWKKSPAEFGYIGAPSFEQHIQMREAATLAAKSKEASFEEEVVKAVRLGRPPKA